MPDYKAMYFKLMAKIADVIDILTKLQQECEEMYIKSGDTEEQAIIFLPSSDF